MSLLNELKLIGDIGIGKDKRHLPADMPEMHSHEHYELYFLLSGERRYFIEHTIYDVEPGDIVLIPKNKLHRTAACNGNGYERYVVYFGDGFANDMIEKIGAEAFERFIGSGSIQLSPEVSEKICKSLRMMEWERAQQSLYYEEMISNILYNVILTILRHGQIKQRKQGEDADKIQEAARYISIHYSSNITLSTAAKLALMEETYFSKKFKSLTGFGFNEYLIQTRIKAAEELLMFSDLSVSEISERCGFSSSNYFGDVFKKWKGISPLGYRKTAN